MDSSSNKIKFLIAAAAVLAISVVFTIYSCGSYSDAMTALNANPDYVESETLNTASANISNAASALEYSPERIWTESHRVCNHRDDDGVCTSHSTYFDTHRIPEDCPDPYDAKRYVQNAISLLEQTSGTGRKFGAAPPAENGASITTLEVISTPLPDENEVCVYRGYHANEDTFSKERSILEAVYGDVEAHSKLHDEKVPSNLKSARNWSIFGLIASIFGILASVCFGVFVFAREARGW